MLLFLLKPNNTMLAFYLLILVKFLTAWITFFLKVLKYSSFTDTLCDHNFALFQNSETAVIANGYCARAPLQSSGLGALEVRTTRID